MWFLPLNLYVLPLSWRGKKGEAFFPEEGTRVKSYLYQMQIVVQGKLTDDFTRCQHYQSRLDIIAIKFKCCNTYYACIHCHEEVAKHKVALWPQNEWNKNAVLCGQCKTEISINDYFKSNYKCPNCSSIFNPKCKNHNHLYFDVSQ